MAKRPVIKGNAIILDAGYDYAIDLERCNSAGKILGWIDHLTRKNWLSPQMLRQFVQLAADHAGIDIDYNA